MSNGQDPDGGPTGNVGVGQGPASDPTGADVAGSMSAPSIGGASPASAGDLSGGLGDIEASIAAEDMGYGFNFDAPPGGWGVNVAGPSVNTQGQVRGGHHAGTAADSFAEAIDALDAAIGSMPDISTNAPPSTGLPGMGYGSTVGYNENFDPMGSSHMGQYGQGHGVAAYGGPGQTMGTGIGGVMSGIASPGLGYGTGALGEMGAAAPTGIGNPMGYGMDSMSSAGLMGPGGVGTGAPGGPNQNQAAGIGGPSVSNVGAIGSVTADVPGQGLGVVGVGGQGTGAPGGPGQNAGAGQMAGGLVGGMPGPTAGDAQAWGDDTGAATSAGVGLSGTTDDPGIPGSGGGWGQGIADRAAEAEAQAQAARDAAAAEDAMALARDNPYGLNQSGLQGMRSAEAEDAMMFDRDAVVQDTDVDAAVQAMRDALRDQPPEDFTTEDDETDPVASGMPVDPATGQPVDSTAYTESFVSLTRDLDMDPDKAKATLNHAVKGKGLGWAAFEVARMSRGMAKSTAKDRMAAAVANTEADIAQTEMEMNVSTGEDERTRLAKVKAIGNFRKQYKWAKDMSAKEIQAYIDNPALLSLKVGNEKMRAMDPKNMTANDIRQLWAPAMSA